MKNLIPVVSVVGPTASGKTKLSLILAEKFCGEIISADSMQIYKEFNISTAKPTAEELNKIPHHLIDFLPVSEEFSVAKYVELAGKAVKDIQKRGKLPFLVGGTGLYVDSFLKNTQFESKAFSEKSLGKTKALQNLTGLQLMEILLKTDKKSAEKIHVNDTKRLRRAIEFFYTSGYPISMQTENSKKAISPYKVCKIGLDFKNRDILYQKINSRVDKMFENGIVDEIESVSKGKVGKTAQSAIGYKEILPYINGEKTLAEVSESLKKATRNYAKRQLTWFRRDKETHIIYVDEHKNFSEVISEAKNITEKFIF